MRQALASTIGPRARNKPAWRGRDAYWPAPTQGWDTETPLAELPLTRARKFDNWLPSGVQLRLRKGYSSHVTGLGAAVETLMPYNAGASSALFGAAGTSVFNVTSAGSVGSAVLTSMGNARFSHTNITTSGGSFLWICNGSADPRHWNGSAWATPSLTITTYTDNDISFVHAFKERLFFIFKNTLTMGYLPVQSVAGTVDNFPLGAVFNYGGRLIALGSISKDGGAGFADYFVALTSEGEVAVYEGFNPGSATEWGLVGVYYVGEPVGDRPLVDMGDDLAVITRNGLISLSHVMAGVGDADANAHHVSARISTAFREATALGASYTGWEGVFLPEQDMLVINAPTGTETAVQLIRHRVTGGWGRFTGWDFETFEVLGGECYAGGSDGTVYLCFDGNDDNGADITGSLETAWSTLGIPSIKALLEVRPIITTATRAVLRIVGRTDFRDSPPLPAWPASTITNALIWGSGVWGTNLWGGEDFTTRAWRAISGDGHSVSLAMEARSNQSALGINGFNLRFQVGGQV